MKAAELDGEIALKSQEWESSGYRARVRSNLALNRIASKAQINVITYNFNVCRQDSQCRN